MAFLDFIKNRNAQQQPVAQPQQSQNAPGVESLPASVKSQAVEAARPAAQVIDKAVTEKAMPPRPPAPTQPARGRGLGMER